MDAEVLSILDGLRSTSSSHVQECLLKLRNKVKTKEGIKLFTKYGGLNYLVTHLRKPNERILDLTLSILGACCLNDDFRLTVGNLPIVPAVISVLTTVCRDSIVGRGCRVLGNLAQDLPNATNLHNHGAVQALISVIESRDKTTSYPTLTMAVRGIRQLWMVPDKRDEMLSVNSVQCIAKLLITECESVGLLNTGDTQNEALELRRSQEELFGGILKCIAYCTTHVTAQCAEQVQGDGRGFQCLVAMTKVNEYQALRCLINLCYLSECRPLLGAAGLVSCLSGILQKNSDNMSWWPEGTVRMLCQLSADSVNRARIREAGVLPLLVSAAYEHTFALRALLQYVFDDLSIQILANTGLVTLLTSELIKHLGEMDCEHDFQLYAVRTRKGITNADEDGLRVAIERDNVIYGFNNTSEGIHKPNEDENNPEKTVCKWLKRSLSMSPTVIRKRSRENGTMAFCNGASTSAASSAAPPPTSPGSDGHSGFSPEWRGGKRGPWDWSPESGIDACDASPHWTEFQWSPSSTASPKSPFSGDEELSDSEVSGRYSPVCSEHDVDVSEIVPLPPIAAELDAALFATEELVMDDVDMEHNDEAPFEEPEGFSYLEMESSRVACVLVLMYRLARLSCDGDYATIKPYHTVELLKDHGCMNALIDYVLRCRKPMGRVARILGLVISNPCCLMDILAQKLVLKLHNMVIAPQHPVAKCPQCQSLQQLSTRLLSQLTLIAESRYGLGVISHQLLRGGNIIKATLAMTLPYIVESKAVLRKYYIECNALDILIPAVHENHQDFVHYITGLSKFATSVAIKDPKDLHLKYSSHICIAYDPILDGLSHNEIVTFELDDFSTVKANKTFLCQNSEVFCAMLTGCFKESLEESVRLQKVTKGGLEYLLTLLHFGLNNAKCKIEVFPMADKLETNLEVLLLADRFLLEKLKVSLHTAIIQFKMLPNTVDKIHAWSLSEGMGALCVESVAYLLVGKMCEDERSLIFRKVLSLQYKEQWLEDIKSAIVRQLEDCT